MFQRGTTASWSLARALSSLRTMAWQRRSARCREPRRGVGNSLGGSMQRLSTEEFTPQVMDDVQDLSSDLRRRLVEVARLTQPPACVNLRTRSRSQPIGERVTQVRKRAFRRPRA